MSNTDINTLYEELLSLRSENKKYKDIIDKQSSEIIALNKEMERLSNFNESNKLELTNRTENELILLNKITKISNSNVELLDEFEKVSKSELFFKLLFVFYFIYSLIF